jgi:hypothetical protein
MWSPIKSSALLWLINTRSFAPRGTHRQAAQERTRLEAFHDTLLLLLGLRLVWLALVGWVRGSSSLSINHHLAQHLGLTPTPPRLLY